EADPRRRLADRPGPTRAVPREGAARGEADDELGRAGRRPRTAREGFRAEPLLEPGATRRLRAVRGPSRAGGWACIARRATPPSHEPRPARPLPGRRALVAQPRRSRQPPADRLDDAGRRPARAGTDPPDAEGPPAPARPPPAHGAARGVRRRIRAARPRTRPGGVRPRRRDSHRGPAPLRRPCGRRRPRPPARIRPGAERPHVAIAVFRTPHKPLSPAPSPQGIREDAGPGWPRPAVAGEP